MVYEVSYRTGPLFCLNSTRMGTELWTCQSLIAFHKGQIKNIHNWIGNFMKFPPSIQNVCVCCSSLISAVKTLSGRSTDTTWINTRCAMVGTLKPAIKISQRLFSRPFWRVSEQLRWWELSEGWRINDNPDFLQCFCHANKIWHL